LKLDTLVMIQTKFGFHWSSTFRGEDFWKSLRRTTDDDDERQVMAIAHLTLWVRWAKKMIEGPNRRTHFWKRTIQWLFHQNCVLIEQMVSDKKIFMGISHRVLF
jgi:hypothetical protein